MRIRNVAILIVLLAILVIYTYSANAEAIQTLNLPTSLETIGEQAFYQDTSLNKVVVPEGATSIESMAFAYSSLQEISLPRSITSIAEDAFDGCGQFKVNAPFGCYAYTWCMEHGYIGSLEPSPAEDFTYEPINGLYARITKYIGSDSIVVIPDEIDDFIIQAIGEEDFHNTDTIECIVIPDTVIELERQAFSFCDALETVEMGENITTVGNWVFYGNPNLKRIDFPESVTTMGRGVLGNCVNLEYVGYPVNWEVADNSGEVFADCPKLKVIDVPEGTTVIPNYAFANCPNIERINLPEGLEQIYHHAFSNCTGLTEMDYPSTVKTVGGIDGCTGITSIVIPENAEAIGTNAFDSVPLCDITIPDSVTTIENYAFHNCAQLTTVNFGGRLKSIGLSAFSSCIRLEKLSLPDSVETIGYRAFANCAVLSEFHYPKNWVSVLGSDDWISEYGHHFDECVRLRRIEIPEGVTAIPRNAFAYATYLRNVTFPSTLKTIGPEAFRGCTAFTSLSINQGVEYIAFGAFRDCENLVTADLPDSVNNIGCYVFAGCKKLASFHFPTSWTTTSCSDDMWDGEYYLYWGHHFDDCMCLKTIEIPEGIESIPSFAFQDATYITSVSFPASLKRVGYGSFEGCTGIYQVDLPDSVEEMGCYAFAGCTGLSNFHYPANWIVNFTSDSFWTGKYSLDNGRIFEGCSSLKHIDIPEGVKSILTATFCNASGLIDVSIPCTLEVIQNDAFAGCENLEKVYLGYNVIEIGDNAFGDCPKLTIWTEYGAYALQYAIDNNIPYYYLTPDGVNSPSGTLYKGDSYALYGYARASVPLTDVTATIWDSTGTDVIQTISVNPEMTDYSLSGVVNMSLLFDVLPLGSYRYSLTASTEESEEVWADTLFTIVPPPLRISIRDKQIPNGLTDISNGYTISGTIVSNYPITELTISVFTGDGVELYTRIVKPGTLTYSVADLASEIPVASLIVGYYSIRITAVANGETRVLENTTFQPVDLDGEVDEATIQAVVRFVSNDDNLNLFPSNYVNSTISNMNFADVLIMAINSRDKWVYGMASTLFTENHENLYLVDLYENELASIIADLNPDTIMLDNIDSTQNMISNALIDFNLDVLDAYKQGLLDRFKYKDTIVKKAYMEHIDSDFKEISSSLKSFKTGLKGVRISIDLANNFSRCICNYMNGLEILNVVIDSMDNNNSPEFKMAVMKLYAKYKSESLNKLLNSIDLFTKEILNWGTEAISSGLFKLVSETESFLNAGTLYGIVNFSIDVAMKATGYGDIADDYQTFMIQEQTYNTGRKTYMEAFNAVRGGDTSARAINKLIFAFKYAKQSSLRIHETIMSIRSTTSAVKKEILDYTSSLTMITITG